ncbi:polysaccharide pyruvyl transferase family protein [Herbiconiux sp. P15]|uniref:polysaccharide pyruvyl transferase family protein n=1 Tax=Herbiconiux liukaitaii TaxID=3342799 RepID=UPI0035B6F9A8
MTTTNTRKLFIVLTGVSGNLGDAVIRRRILSWVRGTGEVHAYLGRTTPGWVEQIGLTEDEHAYDAGSRKRWLKELVFGRGPRAWIFDPGEVPLGRAHLKSELVFLAIAVLVRLRGGKIIRPPRAIGEYDRVVGLLYRWSARLSQEVLWRDEASLALMKVGKLVPDTAFSEPRVQGLPFAERKTIIVSLRGKRPYPTPAWFEAVRTFADETGFRVNVVSQVDEDEVRSAEVAAELGDAVADYLPWGERSDAEQEKYVRDLYESTALVISDRLHVLILAAQAGAIPTEAVISPKPKVEQHFLVAGYPGPTLDTAQATAPQIVAFLHQQLGRSAELDAALASAAARLHLEITRIRAILQR